MKKIFLLIVSTALAIVNVVAQNTLKADGPGDTYELITQYLAPDGFPLEPPDCSHEAFGRHIDEVWDSTLNEYVFRFFIHVVPDDDRCIHHDRQRNEIKVYTPSPDSLKGFSGDKMVYTWKMKLPEGFQSSSSFTHIHQLKAIGGDEDGMPIITLTPRKGSPDRIQLRFAAHSSPQTLSAFPITDITGKWVNIIEKVTYGENGSYEITINDLADGSQIFHYKKVGLRMWRTGTEFVRPKWGIYRKLSHPEDLRDEEILMNEFYIKKVSATSIKESEFENNLTIYPNPAKDKIYYRSDDGKLKFEGIFNAMGKPVTGAKNSGNEIILGNQPAGLYFLKFRNGNTVFFKKVLIIG